MRPELTDTPTNALQLARALQVRGYRITLRPLTRDTWVLEAVLGVATRVATRRITSRSSDTEGLVRDIVKELG